jgi:hypothetical protein
VTCNNPFWGNSAYYPNSMAPVDYTSGQKQRSDFANHAYIVAPTFSGSACILDATSGPHVGNEDLNTYLQNSIDHGKSHQLSVVFNPEDDFSYELLCCISGPWSWHTYQYFAVSDWCHFDHEPGRYRHTHTSFCPSGDSHFARSGRSHVFRS